MKRLTWLLLFTALLLCGCKSTEKVFKPVMPTDVISEAEAEEAVGGGYDLKLDFDAVVEISSNTYKASYLAEPKGSGDPVFVTVTSPSDTLSEGDIRNIFDSEYEKRTGKTRVEGIGNEAYIAFPSIRILESGYLLELTAGSGDTDEQKELLLLLGQKATENLKAILQENKK